MAPPDYLESGYNEDGYYEDGYFEADAASPPSFSGPLPDIDVFEDTGDREFDLGSFFEDAESFAIDPAVEVGWDFDTGTGVLTVVTDDAGDFGPYTVTATNANGDTDSNAFAVAIHAHQATVGIDTGVVRTESGSDIAIDDLDLIAEQSLVGSGALI